MNELILLVIVAVLLVLLLVPQLAKTLKTKRKPIDKRFIKQRWQEITATGKRPDESARYAVVEADKLLDYVLKRRGYNGETMGERLNSARDDFSYLDDVWSAHKLRNKLVHEAQYQVDRRVVQRSLDQFEQALKDLGAL